MARSYPVYRWDGRVNQYVASTGRFVSRAQVRGIIDGVLQQELKDARARSLALRAGTLSLETWRAEMRAMIKNVHLMSGAAAKGGWAQLTPQDYGAIGAIVKSEYRYLERLAQGIAAGTISLDGRVVNRAMMYAEAGRQTYHTIERLAMRRAGYVFEQNILDRAAESCAMCEAQTARGWVPIGDLVQVGARTCLRRCRCRLDYRKTRP